MCVSSGGWLVVSVKHGKRRGFSRLGGGMVWVTVVCSGPGVYVYPVPLFGCSLFSGWSYVHHGCV